MFKSKKKDRTLVVTTKSELKAAIKRKEPCIRVNGNLAKKIKWMKRLSPAMLAALIPLLVTAASPIAPMAAAVSFAEMSAITGTEIAKIIFAGGLSVSIVLAVLKGYNVEIRSEGNEVVLTSK